jgi:hypothetical protein
VDGRVAKRGGDGSCGCVQVFFVFSLSPHRRVGRRRRRRRRRRRDGYLFSFLFDSYPMWCRIEGGRFFFKRFTFFSPPPPPAPSSFSLYATHKVKAQKTRGGNSFAFCGFFL